MTTIEIDLSDIVDDFDEKKVESAICNGNYTKLLYSNKYKDVYAKLILGDWKKIQNSIRNPYVNECPLSHKRAYFEDFKGSFYGGSSECHSCYGFEECDNDDMYLCRGFFGKLDFAKIEKIISITRENNVIKYAELFVDGEVKRFGKP